MFEKYFYASAPTVLAQKLFETKNKNKNNDFVNVIKSGLRDLKDEIEKMSEYETKLKKTNKILKLVKKILNFNKKNTIRKRIKNTNTKPNA